MGRAKPPEAGLPRRGAETVSHWRVVVQIGGSKSADWRVLKGCRGNPPIVVRRGFLEVRLEHWRVALYILDEKGGERAVFGTPEAPARGVCDTRGGVE